MKEDIILNSLVKLERLANAYKENKTSQNLVNFVHYRTDFIQFVSFLWLEQIVSNETSWMLQCYTSVVTDELEIFDNGKSVPEVAFANQLKDWRNGFGWLG